MKPLHLVETIHMKGFMGSNIKETEVPFDIKRKLTEKEIEQTVFYCRHDVEVNSVLILSMN